MNPPIFKPQLAGAHFVDRLRACLGATIGIALTIVICARLAPGVADLPIIVAPIGASAVLVFAVPASPLAQPWAVIGGNVLSALIGAAVFRTIADATIAAGVAVGAAILLMSLLRCLHPPGGAAALTAVIGGQSVHAAGYGFAFAPVGINAIALVALAMIFHRATGHSYPHRPPSTSALETARADAGLHLEDIDRALAEAPDGFDIGREDLDLLLARAEHHAIERRARG